MTEGKGNIMTIPPDLEAQILRYHHVEKWRAGTIARQLRVHYDTVLRVLLQAGLSRNGSLIRRSQIEPYLPFIRETLAQYPTLTASRLSAWCASVATAAIPITSAISLPAIDHGRQRRPIYA